MAIAKQFSFLMVLALSSLVFGQEIPNTFQAGNPIIASEVNENFQALRAEIEVLKAQLESQQTEAIPREFVGVTTEKTTGAGGGRFGMNQRCANQYAGSTMCLASEVYTVDPSKITENGWVDVLEGNTVFQDAYNCSGWTSSTGARAILTSTGRTTWSSTSSSVCGQSHSVACCK